MVKLFLERSLAAWNTSQFKGTLAAELIDNRSIFEPFRSTKFGTSYSDLTMTVDFAEEEAGEIRCIVTAMMKSQNLADNEPTDVRADYVLSIDRLTGMAEIDLDEFGEVESFE